MVAEKISQYTLRMHLGIDVREACAQQRTGKGQWTYGFVSQLLTRDHELTLYTDTALPSEWQMSVDGKENRHVVFLQTKGFVWHWKVALHFLQHEAIHTYISTVSYIVPFIIGRRKNVIPVVHDLIAFQNEPHDRRATLIERLTLRRAAHTAARLCTVSNATKRDLLDRYPQIPAINITPIFAGPMSHDAIAYHSDQQTILCIATLCPRKNQLRLIQAFAALPSPIRESHRLILVGKRGWEDDAIIALAEKTPGVEWKKYLSNEECTALLARAAVFAFPSLYEGFGMPLLDAFRIGVPVLTSDRGSLKEVAGDAALLIDPEHVENIRDGLLRLLTDDALRTELSEKGKAQEKRFSWQKTVDLFLESLPAYTDHP